MGVELFFSLSGFLISGILLDQATRAAPRFPIGSFWWRRWLRTLPAFYLYFAFVCFMLGRIDWPTAFFVQAFFPASIGFYSVAWSLAKEEWFYLLFPLLVWAISAVARKADMRRSILLAAIGIILVCNVARLVLFHYQVHSRWVGELSFNMHPLLRLDCCAYGVLLAMVVRGNPSAVKAWLARRWPAVIVFCGAVLIGLGALLEILDQNLGNPSFVAATYFNYWANAYFSLQFSLIDFVMAVVVTGFYFVDVNPPRWLKRFVVGMSRSSYSLYLLHILINIFLLARIMSSCGPVLGMILYLFLLVAGSLLSYRLIERPFLILRDLWSDYARSRQTPAELSGKALVSDTAV